MKRPPEMMDFVKALAHADRLKIVGMLVQNPATLAQVTAGLSLPNREVYNHLEFLKYVQVVDETDGTYRLNTGGLEKFSRQQLEGQRQTFTPDEDLDSDRRKVLAAFLKDDGTIRKIPNSRTQAAKFRILLEYVLASFEPGSFYTEKEVNIIIRRLHADAAGLRRDLVDAGLLERKRDGSWYWRRAEGETAQ
jgi:hypothetical protein